MKKKIGIFLVSLVLLATLAFGLVGCTKNGGKTGKKRDKTQTLKIGVLHIGPQAEETGYSAAHHRGIEEMKKAVGLSDKQVIEKWSVSDNEEDKINSAIQALIQEECNVIIGTSFGYQGPMAKFADKYKNIIFSHGTGYIHNDTNMNNYFGKVYQARYLSGVVAGLKAKEIGKNKLGYVSAYGNKIAETVSGFNAFYLGAKAVNPDVTMDVDLIDSWYDPIKELKKAQTLLGNGAGVISHHSDTVNVCKAAKDAGKFSVGYNTDMENVGKIGDSVLTSVIWNWGVYYTKLIKAIQNKDFKSVGQYYEGYAEGLIDIIQPSKKAAAETKEYLELVEGLLKKGEWDVFSGKALEFKTVDGKLTVEQKAVDFKGRKKAGAALETVIKAGEAVEYGVIQGTMDYVLEGINGGLDKE